MEKKRKRGAFVEFKSIKKQKQEEKQFKCSHIICNKLVFIRNKCSVHLIIDINNNKININSLSLNELLLLKNKNITDKLKQEIELVVLTKTFKSLKVNT
jgi:hypothetical protein